MSLHALAPGYALDEYRIEKLLGEGGFGLTYLAFDTNLDKKVAIKEYMPSEHAVREIDITIVPKSESSTKVYNWGLNAFLNEAKTLAKFEDPNIVRIYRFFKANGTAYIVMEYCEGGCLIDRITKNQGMEEAIVLDILSSICHGLQLVHDDGILHRDIKPDNIMFRQDGPDGTPVLIDFGAARQAIGGKSRKITTIVTPGYAPLEQYSTKGHVGPWSDIYSLAAVAYLCITGKKPPDIMNRLHDDTLERLSDQKNVSPFLKAIDKGLNLQIDDRPQSISEWLQSWGKSGIHLRDDNKTPSQKPIYASKYTGAHKKFESPQPITARPISETDENTILNTSLPEEQQAVKSRMNIGKIISTLLIFSILGLFGYNYYLTQQGKTPLIALDMFNKEKTPNTSTIIKQQTESNNSEPNQVAKIDSKIILETQQLLNILGFEVDETGQVDTWTQESIKLFKKNNKLTTTTNIDSTLINELKNIIDDKAWALAIKNNTTASYNQYLADYPEGNHSSQVAVFINKIKDNGKAIQLKKIAKKSKEASKEAPKKITKKTSQESNDVSVIVKKTKEDPSITNKPKDNPIIAKNIVTQKAKDIVTAKVGNSQQDQLNKIAAVKKLLVRDFQIEFQRLKYKDLVMNGELDKTTTNIIIAYQKLKKIEQTGLPTKTLLFQLKSEKKWPGRLLGEAFQDCPICPEMIVIPAGSFMMGSLDGKANELPIHNVDIKEFVMSKAEITFEQWDACVEDGICSHSPQDDNLGRGNLAVMRVNYQDIQQFLLWLNNITKQNYRLPSEAEWEYAARAGKSTAYSWGDDIGANNASCIGCNIGVNNNKINQIKNYPANAYGLFDMHGNVWEWTQDCWHSNYLGAPSNGEAWEPNNCQRHVVRGGSGGNKPSELRSASRGVIKSEQRLNSIGFRVALDSN